MPEGQDRLPPIPDDRLTEEQRAAVAKVKAGPRGELAANWVPFLRSPELMDRVQLLGEYLRFDKTISDDLLELAILCVARHWNNDFEWWFHHPLALAAGLPAAAVDELGHGRPPSGVRPEVRAVHALVVQMLRTGEVDDTRYADALDLIGETGVVEVASVVGYYTTLALTMNLARTPVPPGPRLPDLGG